MPNVHGKRSDASDYAGVAVQVRHGTAISWDGRVVRHCTSIPMPDGVDGYTPWTSRKFENNVYGTFTAAKERVVQAGRSLAAAAFAATAAKN
jgi:hypothetical protein